MNFGLRTLELPQRIENDYQNILDSYLGTFSVTSRYAALGLDSAITTV